ncbi:DMT family transporter [Aquabacter sp. CN5-332]|uniref:DMT family transporter n=1 Tax=Aquabacter sp. CN5-332 TaxID=3156608 RepID=UPI0032B470CC
MTPSQRAASTPGLDATPGLIALFCILWSSAFAAGKIALWDCPPLLLLTFRFLLAGSILLAGCAAFGRFKRLKRREWAALILAGTLNNALYLGLSFTGLATVSSAFTAVIISANPLLTALVAGPILGERLTPRKMLGLLLGFVGVIIVLRSRLAGGHEALTGTLFVLAALVALTAGTLTYKRFGTKADLFQASGIQCLAGGIVLMPVALATESLSAIHLTPTFIGAFAFLTIAVSIGGYSLWYFILGRSSATEATALHFIMPPLGLFFGWLILGEMVPPLDFLGILPIAAGIWLVTR